MFKKLYSFLCKLAITYWWPCWSNVRWHNSIRNNVAISEVDKFSSLIELQQILKRVYSVFEYTPDSIDQLFDAIIPPPQNYLNYLDGVIKDDCDGFHSVIYHIITNNAGTACYLMTANAPDGGHCLLLVDYFGKWYVIDYTSIYPPADSPKEAVLKYNTKFSSIYNTKEVLYNGFLIYDYKKGKFKSVKLF